MRKNKTDNAYERLKLLFQEGKLERDRVIPVSEIADSIEMGRAPVLNALKLLESEGYLRIMPQKGIMIKEMTIQEMKEINDVRYALETYVISRVALETNEEDIQKMRRCIDEQKVAMEGDDPSRFIRSDEDFHFCIYEKMKNSLMTELIQRLRERFFAVGKHLVMCPGRMETTISEHEAIVEYLSKKDPEGSLKAMIIHLENGRRLIF